MKLKTITDGIARARKTVAAVAGFIAEGIALGVLHGTLLHVAQGVLAVLTAAGVYAVANKPASLLDRQ